MIRAVELSRSFGGATALDRVSFEVQPGEVLGLLGPNGAGKTTALRILAGYLAPSSGHAAIGGHDVVLASRASRTLVGYLPESAPLPAEMRVVEYLGFRAALKELPARQRQRAIARALEETDLASERRRIIGQLSKGQRQRVGLADALLGRPPVLILDEPTEGLDPNQRRAVLELVAGLGAAHTVLWSTHILPEVEAVSTRVLILDRGRVVAEGRPRELARASGMRVIARGPAGAIGDALAALVGVRVLARETAPDDASVTAFSLVCERDAREEIAAVVVRLGQLRELRPAGALEAIFARLTRPGDSS